MYEDLIIGNIKTKYLNHSDPENSIIDYTFQLNSDGYRSKEFSTNTETLILGCSHTYGLGLPDGFRWVDYLSEKLNQEFDILALPGDSTMGQIMKAFYYFKKFGNPKRIIALFPMNRLTFPHIEGKLMSVPNTAYQNVLDKKDANYSTTIDIGHYTFQKYSKAPYNLGEILPAEFVFYHERAMLDMLEQYCQTNNIDFIWSVWHYEYQDFIFNRIENEYPGYHKNYCWLKTNSWNLFKDIDLPKGEKVISCHKDLQDELLFNIAADRSRRTPHWGFHRHMHIADEFYKYLVKNSNI